MNGHSALNRFRYAPRAGLSTGQAANVSNAQGIMTPFESISVNTDNECRRYTEDVTTNGTMPIYDCLAYQCCHPKKKVFAVLVLYRDRHRMYDWIGGGHVPKKGYRTIAPKQRKLGEEILL